MADALQERDAKVVWHPYTQMMLEPEAIPVVRGEGARLYDAQGNSYIDAVSSWWVNLHGHCHPLIVSAVERQLHTLEQVIFAGFTHEPAVRLAERLIEMLPGKFARVFFSDDGSTAVEVALKMALQCWHNRGAPKRRIVSFKGGYHGDTFGAMSVGRGQFTAPFEGQLFEVSQLPIPVPGEEAKALSAAFEEASRGDVAAFIYEPLVLGAAGMKMYSASVLEQILRTFKSNGVLLIADEVMTGFGRTGRRFASEAVDCSPDLICLSKGLTGGFLPLGATAASQEIYESFLSSERLRMFLHGHSFSANPLACAAANASLDLLLDPATAASLARIEKLQSRFISQVRGRAEILDARCLGTIAAFEVQSRERSSYINSIRDVLYRGFISQRVLLRPLGNTVYLMPPYCITDDELAQVYHAIETVIAKST